ncbi:hypothetical protein BSL82_17395 [Tardibacter chloracetimidivorans]|uniref:EthD domain-containing protein n=1 Tax=Tardibacter chloracetimidivorans TaxID=1921510 RepID=A0A1L3ZYY6_9SPHN|nr:EthD domain-containing protein [Tardibacter chloracetimidivorans]API60837.1 hypothetical protein BSL82_17395 [Tardibacter chloracetimidivorans]
MPDELNPYDKKQEKETLQMPDSHETMPLQNLEEISLREEGTLMPIDDSSEPVKMIMLIKRKSGLTPEEFKKHYEAYHSKLGQKFFGHLMTSYKRNYVALSRQGIGSATRTVEWGYDCITEFIYPNMAARMEVVRLAKVPEIARELREDEAKFADGPATIMMRCEPFDTGTGDGHGSLPFR